MKTGLKGCYDLLTLLGLLFLSTLSVQAGETTDKFGITMVDIPAGSFMMGSCKQTAAMDEENIKRAFLGQPPLKIDCGTPDNDASDDETPLHQVQVSAFKMGKTEVTLGQFKKFVAEAGRTDLVSDDFMQYNNQGDQAPVVMVSWHDAQDFIAWLNQQTSKNYQLPSEAQWEYACRAGGRQAYCGGNNIDDVAWYIRNIVGGLHPVGQKQANGFGLYDMSGNVLEWCRDWYAGDYYKHSPPADPNGPSSGEARVNRGGSWMDSPRRLRSANRDYDSPGSRSVNLGFRLSLPAQ